MHMQEEKKRERTQINQGISARQAICHYARRANQYYILIVLYK